MLRLDMNLQVHHLNKRSQLGSDAADNLITLCASCHGRQHNII
jgi:5-methylcytosine-specific restriction endonuclease McrA